MTQQSKGTVNSNKVANSAKQTNVGQILAQKLKGRRQSAYGATVDLICEDLTLLGDRARLVAKLEEQGINVKASKNAIQTGISQTRNVVLKLHQNGFLS